ncbi:alpha/beta hydrolase [Steroidobacter flavus]|uniref:Alpha/beta hydrolase n=1 Tax=Steroidobacter flavus TaxID=1842136 RepID=A0ABV8SY07_9GAMM
MAKASTAASSLQRTSHLYATKEGQQLFLDLIVDSSVKVTGKRPAIVFSFGGGWEGGARNDQGLEGAIESFTSMGYAVAAIDYRLGIKIAKQRKELTPENGTQMYLRAIEWGVEDIFDATSLVLKRADEWNIDKDQIVLMGGSSGATDSLVAEYNVANETELARNHLPTGFRYAGVISMAGAFWLKANTPLLFKNKPAPIMFFHGAKDQLVTYDEVQGPFSGYGPVYYFRRFAGPDYPKWFVDYPQGDHIIAAFPSIDSMYEMKAFLQKLVKERQQLSIHTVEEGKVPKTFQNAAQLLPKPAK